MITKREVLKYGYTVLPKGGWIQIEPEQMPHDWDGLAKQFGFDPNCKSIVLCIAGVKENDQK